MSRADQIFIDNCKQILLGDIDKSAAVRPKWADGEPAYTIKKFGIVNRYDLALEFPILTIRRTYLKSAIDELLWIWQKKSNNVNDFEGKIWDAWADSDGSIGKSYGYQLKKVYDFAEGQFDQVDYALYLLKNSPNSRRIICSMFNHADLKDMNLQPCAYSVTFNVNDGKLNAILNQRSQDMLVANNWNVCQYAVLVHMFARVCGLKVGELVHVIADAHIYDRHIPIVQEIIEKKRYGAPTMTLDEAVSDFYAFTPDSVQLLNYQYNSFDYKMEVSV
jgi:thymidylate synthase